MFCAPCTFSIKWNLAHYGVVFFLTSELNRMHDTKPNQFGFKKKHSTDMCIYLLKEAIERYKSLGSCVYMCFIDASKAFDRVNHDVSFKMLVNWAVSGYIRLLLIQKPDYVCRLGWMFI